MRNINKSNGFIPIYRSLFEEPIWLTFTPEQKIIYLTLISKSNHSANEWSFKGRLCKVFPGSMITSVKTLIRECGKGITTQMVRTALKKFEKLELIKVEPSSDYTLVTISNYNENYTVKGYKTKGQQQSLSNSPTHNHQSINEQLINEQQ